MKKNKFSVRWNFIFSVVMLFIVNLFALRCLRITNNFTILIFSIIYLSILILFIIAYFAIDISFYFKLKKFRKWQKEQDECYKRHFGKSHQIGKIDKPKFSKKSIEKPMKTSGCFFVINPAYDERDLSSKRYMKMSFCTVGNKIDQKTLKAEYSDYHDFRKDKNKWYINLFKKLRRY